MEDKSYQQNRGMAMGSSLSLVVCNSFYGILEKLALNSVRHKPAMWLRYVDDIFFVVTWYMEKVKDFFLHVNSLRSSTQVTTETK